MIFPRKMDSVFPALALTFSALVFVCLGCGGSSSPPPTFPDETGLLNSEQVALPSQVSAGTHTLLGAYKMRLSDDGTFEMVPIRTTEMHVNVTKLLFPPKCLDCFLAELVDVLGETWLFKFTIRNPSGLTGYDTRVTLQKLGDIKLLEISSYTSVFALPSDPDPVNPFVVFDSGAGQNKWGPGASAVTPVTFVKPTGSKFTEIKFVIDASFPYNQEDPYMITGINADPPVVCVDGLNNTNIAATVLDWQNNVNSVTVDLSPLGGSGSAEMTNVFGNTWLLENLHYQNGGQGIGTYDLLITASSVGQKTYNYVTVKVDELPDASITVVSPNGGEEWGTNTDEEITWTSDGVDGTVFIEYSKDNFVSDIQTIAPDEPCDGSFTWVDVPKDLSATVRVRIFWKDYPGIFDISDADFSIIGAPTIGWARTWGSTVDDYGGDVRVDENGNTFATGYLMVIFDSPPTNVFLTSYDPSGELRWTETWGGVGDTFVEGRGICLDKEGDIYVTGGFTGAIDFDPGPGEHLVGAGGQGGAFVSKFDSGGDYQWTCAWWGSGSDWADGCDVVADDSGDIYVTGYFNHACDFDPGPGVDQHTSIGYEDVFLSKFSTEGTWQWSQTWGGTGSQGDYYENYGYGVGVDISGNVYVAGGFEGVCDFDPGPGSQVCGTDQGWLAFLSKFDSTGAFQSVQTWDDSPQGCGEACALTLDSQGNIFTTGYFNGEVDFDPGPSSDIHESHKTYDQYGYDVFLSKYDSTGSYQWTQTWGGVGGFLGLSNEGHAIAVDDLDNVYVSGTYRGKCEFNPDGGYVYESHIGSNGYYGDDVFLSKFDSSGAFQWATAFGGFLYDDSRGVAAYGDSNVFITGSFYGKYNPVDLDPGPGEYLITSNGERDVFLIKYVP